MKRLIFLDVDGTLCDINGHVPQSAIEAVKAARENGHDILLCTGRAKSEVQKQVWDIGFDGLIGSAGAYVEYKGRVLFEQSMDKEVTARLIAWLKEHNMPFLLETTNRVYAENRHLAWLKEMFLSMTDGGPNEGLEFIGAIEGLDDAARVENVNKVIYYKALVSAEEIQKEFEQELLVLPSSIEAMGEGSGEISGKQINKATGIQVVLKHLGMDREAVVAVGDSANDLEMLQFAHVGIAMGNGTEAAKQAAGYVTDRLEEDGIYRCFEKYGLIGVGKTFQKG